MKILDLYNTMRKTMAEITMSPYAAHAQDWIFGMPIFKSPDFTKTAGIPFAVASRLLKQFREKGTLKPLQEASGTRPAVLVFAQLLNIAEEREVF